MLSLCANAIGKQLFLAIRERWATVTPPSVKLLQQLSLDSPSIGRARRCSLARSHDGHGDRDDAVDAVYGRGVAWRRSKWRASTTFGGFVFVLAVVVVLRGRSRGRSRVAKDRDAET